MPNYFYIDANGQKQGPISDQQLKTLAALGIIVSTTPMITDTGHKGLAGQIRGLNFNTADRSLVVQTAQVTPQSVSVQVAPRSRIPMWVIVAGVLCLLLVGVLVRSMILSTSSTPNRQKANENRNAVDNPEISEVLVKEPPPKQNDVPPGRPNVQFTVAEQTEINQFLTEYGKDVTKDAEMLHVAVFEKNVGAIKYLISERLDINARDKYGMTPLHEAVSQESLEIVQFLVSAGADVNAKEKNGFAPLGLALLKKNFEVAKFLVSKGADVNEKGSDGLFLLHYEEDIAIVQFLIFSGADVNKAGTGGFTPLYTAATQGNVEIAGLLISAGANVFAENDYGWTPLHGAASEGHIEIARLLVTARANVNAKTKKGSTPLDLAKDEKKTAMVRYLQSAGGR